MIPPQYKCRELEAHEAQNEVNTSKFRINTVN